MRLALFGGSFDPPHRGHIAVARAAADQFNLDRVLFAPAGLQPLKRQGAIAGFVQRLSMCELACESDARFTVSDVDAPRADGRPNYTVDTLAALRTQYPDATLFSLLGADSFRSFGQWLEPERLLELAEWIIVSRPGYSLADPAGMSLVPAQRARIHLLDTVHEDVSATELRARLAQGERCEDLLGAGVATYIQRNGLYGERNEVHRAEYDKD